MTRTNPISLAILATLLLPFAWLPRVAASDLPSTAVDLSWLEETDSPRVLAWSRARDRAARRWLSAIPGRDGLEARIGAASRHRRYGAPVERSGRYFYASFDPAVTQISAHLRSERSGREETLIEAAELLEREGLVLLTTLWPSPDGRLLAYGVHEPASRWSTLRILDIERGIDLKDRIEGLVGGLSSVWWSRDGRSLYYERYELPKPGLRATAPLRGERVWRHTVGRSPTKDELIYSPEDPGEDHLTVRMSDDHRYLTISVRDGRSTGNGFFVLDLDAPKPEPVALAADDDARISFVGSHGSTIWLQTDREAPRGRVVAVDLEDEILTWHELIPQARGAIDTSVGASAVGDQILVGYREEGRFVVRSFDTDGRARGELALPSLGSIWSGFVGRQGHAEAFYVLSGFSDPGTIYRLDLSTGASSPFLRPRLPYDPREIETRLVHFSTAGRDRVPMYLAHHRETPPGEGRPILIYGYGFGNWAVGPWFRPHLWELFSMGGTFALPALRGGGEFGEEWHRDGVGIHRQNGVDDYIAAAEWLIDHGLATPDSLVAETQSAGASLVGAAINRRPELFAGAILAFPLLDLLSYEQFTRGARWRSELGSVDVPAEKRALQAYSPVHNVRTDACYPPILILPGERDEITPPIHGYRYAAALEQRQQCESPVLLRIAWGAGHAYGVASEDTVASLADQLAFIAALGEDRRAD